ncbi:class I SAM-dependent methyltransferase [Nannocystaceae bacterium ST9]
MRRLASLVFATLLGCEGSTPSFEPDADDPTPIEPRVPTIEEPFAGTAGEAVELYRQRILAASALAPGMRVADIGANQGWFVDRGALAIGPSGTLYATDLDDGALRSLERLASQGNPARARIVVRRAGPRETGLDDLPDNHLDVIWMIDSLCFEYPESHDEDVAYLREFLRLLKPGGRMFHHMDCDCRISPAAVIELFEAAGFESQTQTLAMPQPTDPEWHCQTPEQRERHTWFATFRK